MGSTISAADANRNFSAVLRNVRGGRHYVVTSHGQPVARILPIQEGDRVTGAARAALFGRLKASLAQTIGGWDRDELHERSR